MRRPYGPRWRPMPSPAELDDDADQTDFALYNATGDRLAGRIAHAELVCEANGWSFPDMLRAALEEAQERVAADGGLWRTRPGCWEAEDLRHLVGAPSSFDAFTVDDLGLAYDPDADG